MPACRQRKSPDDFVVVCEFDHFTVSRATAFALERTLDRLPPPRWLTFRDLAGARHRVLARHLNRISESTADQRAAAREFRRARRAEDRSDRSWDDDDYDWRG